MLQFLVPFAAGWLLSEMRPRECPACGTGMEVVSDARQLPIPQKVAAELNAAVAMGAELWVDHQMNKAVVYLKSAAGMEEVGTIDQQQ